MVRFQYDIPLFPGTVHGKLSIFIFIGDLSDHSFGTIIRFCNHLISTARNDILVCTAFLRFVAL